MRRITSFVSTVSKGIVFCTSAAILALGVSSPAGAVIINYKFGLVGVVFNANQAVQVNVAHYGDPDEAPAPCTARVQFIDGITGVLLKLTDLTVLPRQTRQTDLGVTELILQKGKVPIYARVTVGNPDIRPVCRPSLEVFDKVSGHTTVAYGNPNEVGNPDEHFPPLTLAPDQAMRLNVVNYGDPDIAPCPVQLAIIAANGAQVAEQRATLASGVGTFLDVGYGNPEINPQPFRAVGGRVVSRGTDKTLCRKFAFSVEVYDAATGITAVLQQPPEPD